MTPRTMWDGLSLGRQAFLALGSSVAFGFVVAMALAGWVELPAQVVEQGDALVAVQEDVRNLQRAQRSDSLRLARIECIVTAQAREQDPVDRCGL